MSFKIGIDPELFIFDNSTNRFVSAETQSGPMIPGTKSNPFKVNGGAIQVDGVAAEFNTDPSDNFNTFFNNTKSVIKELNSRIKKQNPSYSLCAKPTATFDRNYFDTLPHHTLELGCEPDFNAYTMSENPRPSTDEPFRTGSGHIHIGWTDNADPNYEGHMADCALVVKELDKYLLYASYDWDKDEARRKLYGSKGSFRPKPYGVEYRPLSNAWLKSPQIMKNVFSITMGLMKTIDSGNHTLVQEDEEKLKTDEYFKNRQELVLSMVGDYDI